MLHVAILDDHPAVLAGLTRLIDCQPDLAVLAAAPTAPELATRLDGARADVLVIDYDLADGDGLAHCRRIKNRRSPPAVLIYSAYASPALALAARAAQADGLMDKAEPVSTLLTARGPRGDKPARHISRRLRGGRTADRRSRPPRPGDAARL